MKYNRMIPCLAALLLLSACGQAPQTPPPSSQATAPQADPAPAPGTQSATLALESFSNIEVDVLAAELRLVPGEDWSISYNLSDKEPVEQVGVVGSTLYLETRFDPLKRPDLSKDWYVTITVPEGTVLGDVELDAISGGVTVEDLTCGDVSLSATAGPITVKNLSAREVEAETVAGDLTITASSADKLDAESASGNLTLEGSFGELETNNVSGSTAVTAALTISGELESVSGGIGLSLSTPAAIQASSVGSITLNDTKATGSLNTTGGVPVEVKSVSGQIAIQAP